MTAAWLWARAELRARWRSWVVLGVLAGATAGIVAAGVAGARRTDQALPQYIEQAGRIDAAVLPNDPAFDAATRAEVASLPEVTGAYPFIVPFLAGVTKPAALDGTLLPTTAATVRISEPVIVEGRHTDPRHPDEVTIDENAAQRFGLGCGIHAAVCTAGSAGRGRGVPAGHRPAGRAVVPRRLRVVGIHKSVSSEMSWSPSSGLARAAPRRDRRPDEHVRASAQR